MARIERLESPFEIEELFFSRTDRRGIILSGNSVFQRVSAYNWNELLSKPHNLIRHPDMPKGVFHLLWHNLLKNLPVAAYVKNLSKDGRFYWVLALALPFKDQFISIRLKPTSSTFQLIAGFYEELLATELKSKLSPEASHKLIEEKVKSLGFDNYAHFMSYALSEEMKARQEALSKKNVATNQNLLTSFLEQEKLVKLSEEISKSTQSILNAYKNNRFVALNLQVDALKSSSGQTMGTVAAHFQKMASEIEAEVNRFDNLATTTRAELRHAQFLFLSGQLVREMAKVFSSEKTTHDAMKDDQEFLKELAETYRASVSNTVMRTQDVIRTFGSSCNDVAAINNGLEIIRLTGKIEASRSSEWKACADIIDGLRGFLTFSRDTINQIQSSHFQMKSILDVASRKERRL